MMHKPRQFQTGLILQPSSRFTTSASSIKKQIYSERERDYQMIIKSSNKNELPLGENLTKLIGGSPSMMRVSSHCPLEESQVLQTPS